MTDRKQCPDVEHTPSGNPIRKGDQICPDVTYRVVKVGDRAWNEQTERMDLSIRPRSLRHALADLAALAAPNAVGAEINGYRWRVVEIPAGEHWDYDGTVVAEILVGRGVA